MSCGLIIKYIRYSRITNDQVSLIVFCYWVLPGYRHNDMAPSEALPFPLVGRRHPDGRGLR